MGYIESKSGKSPYNGRQKEADDILRGMGYMIDVFSG